jgi:hypothetical protein
MENVENIALFESETGKIMSISLGRIDLTLDLGLIGNEIRAIIRKVVIVITMLGGMTK